MATQKDVLTLLSADEQRMLLEELYTLVSTWLGDVITLSIRIEAVRREEADAEASPAPTAREEVEPDALYQVVTLDDLHIHALLVITEHSTDYRVDDESFAALWPSLT